MDRAETLCALILKTSADRGIFQSQSGGWMAYSAPSLTLKPFDPAQGGGYGLVWLLNLNAPAWQLLSSTKLAGVSHANPLRR